MESWLTLMGPKCVEVEVLVKVEEEGWASGGLLTGGYSRPRRHYNHEGDVTWKRILLSNKEYRPCALFIWLWMFAHLLRWESVFTTALITCRTPDCQLVHSLEEHCLLVDLWVLVKPSHSIPHSSCLMGDSNRCLTAEKSFWPEHAIKLNLSGRSLTGQSIYSHWATRAVGYQVVLSI